MLSAILDVADSVSVNDPTLRWATLLVTQLVLAMGIVFSFLSTRKKAAEVAAHTADGFPEGVTTCLEGIQRTLTDIKTDLRRVEDKIDNHITDHAIGTFQASSRRK